MTDAGSLDLDQHFSGTRAFQLYRLNAEWFAGLEGYGSAYVH
jgi:hypothetical protein